MNLLIFKTFVKKKRAKSKKYVYRRTEKKKKLYLKVYKYI